MPRKRSGRRSGSAPGADPELTQTGSSVLLDADLMLVVMQHRAIHVGGWLDELWKAGATCKVWRTAVRAPRTQRTNYPIHFPSPLHRASNAAHAPLLIYL